VINKVFARHGTLVIPSFAVGRAQELLHLIHELKEQKQIPDVPVYLDSPMAQDATAIYKKHDDELLLSPNGSPRRLDISLCCSNFKTVKTPDDSMLLCMSDEPKIVISASG